MQEQLLPHLAAVARDARVTAGLSFAHVAVHVHKRGKSGVSESTLHRFEHARTWPEDPDAIVLAYARALSVTPRQLWQCAVTRWRKDDC